MAAKKCVTAPLPQAEIIDIEALASAIQKGSVDLPVVLGPTASGKTRYAVALARELSRLCSRPCEIISADSRQVYRGMDIGTGKDLVEYGEVPYHLIDIRPAGYSYNVFEFQQDFKSAFADIRSRGGIPLLCGGTGLYINAVTSAYDFRTSKPLSGEGEAHRPDARPEGLPRHPYFIGTLVDRELRNHRIDLRLDARLEDGMADEIRSLLESGVSKDKLISYGLEYKYVTLYVTGELSFDQMREKLAIAIHQFAKRQMTWFRGMERSGQVIHWVKV